ncbi:MAG: exopolyphosphatase [Bacteroidetes bacterium]|jgi:nanoRNase/pAp phosphatase (c-di-AMP/oligoRNAs hydrolase)|nr:exopolyphosphatase [Deltaproteobacteria bacterium]MBT4527732.1 exopolyphosphatase [Deltaproteobacteria bacterium]MBT7038820.1 exopolyphosphatase [Bacteroidota bacterium]
MKLITRSDFDGLVCAVLLEERGLIDEYLFVHPKDIQDGLVEITSNDILANIPYAAGCGLWFDHHTSETDRIKLKNLKYEGAISPEPSCAQVIWDYYGGIETFGKKLIPLLNAVNKSDSANFDLQEIIFAEGWVLLSFIMDPRTGLGLYSDYRISNYQLMMDLIRYCHTMQIDEILENPDVKERVDRYNEHQILHKDMLRRCSTIDRNVVITNLLKEDRIYCGNRFIIYASHPDQNIEIRLLWGKNKQNVVFSVGHSILNKTSKTNVGNLMLKNGGGGHHAVGTCQVPFEKWEQVFDEILEQLKQDG